MRSSTSSTSRGSCSRYCATLSVSIPLATYSRHASVIGASRNALRRSALSAGDVHRSSKRMSRTLDMRFEDLCTSPAESAERLSAFLDAPMTDACREYVASGIDTLKVAQYREQDPRLVDEVEGRIGATLRRYRYLP